MRRQSCVLILFEVLLLGTGTLVGGQAVTPPLPMPAQQPQAPPAEQQAWSPQQLDNLVAPIALYPDPLLGQMLVASTYPLELVEASQWLQRNRYLSGRQLMDAAKQQPWDPSIQALVAIPDALAELNKDIGWTTELGDAFLAQQADVLAAVQQMRARAQANGNLHSTPQQIVSTEEQGGQQDIMIQPDDSQVIYVPYYDPSYVWGPPVYGYYPPLLYPGFGFGFGPGCDLGLYFNNWLGWGGWGWGPSWFGQSVFVNNFFFPHHGFHGGSGGGVGGRTVWVHDPAHRLGVSYGTLQVAEQFEPASMASRTSPRARAGSSAAAAQDANSSAGLRTERSVQEGYRNTVPQQRYQAPQQSVDSAPRPSGRVQQTSAPRSSRNAGGGGGGHGGRR